jgi:hypothetical protein
MVSSCGHYVADEKNIMFFSSIGQNGRKNAQYVAGGLQDGQFAPKDPENPPLPLRFKCLMLPQHRKHGSSAGKSL